MLPLALAGEKPDREWVDELTEQGRALPAPHPPPVGALRRPAAARRDRPRARLAADGDVRRRADRQPRLDHRRPRSSPCCATRSRARPDDRDGHPRRARRGDRRPRALPRRRRDRQGPRPLDWRTDPRRDGGGDVDDEARRAEGPARPQGPRDADGARDRDRRLDGQRHVRPHRHDRRRSTASSPPPTRTPTPSSAARSSSTAPRAGTPPCPPRCSRRSGRSRGRPAAGLAAGLSSSSNTAKLLDRDGKIIGRQAATTLGVGIDDAAARFNPVHPRPGTLGRGAGEVVIDAGTAAGSTSRSATRSARPAAGPTRRSRSSASRSSATVTSLGGATIAVFDLPTAAAALRQGRGYDSIAVRPPTASRRRAVDALKPLAARRRRGQDRRRAGRGRRPRTRPGS